MQDVSDCVFDNLYVIEQEPYNIYIVYGDFIEDIIDILIHTNTQRNPEQIIYAINKYATHLTDEGIISFSVYFSVPCYNAISILLSSLSIADISVSNERLVVKLNCKAVFIENDLPSEQTKQKLISTSRTVSKYLRKVHFQTNEKLVGTRKKPLLGFPCEGVVAGSLGPFPEFILPTFPCDKTLQGYCSPCFFSKVSISNASKDEIYRSFEEQTRYIIDNFDEQVVNCQLRMDEETKSLWDITLCFASNGSIFSNSETTRVGRYNAFKMLYDEVVGRNLRSLVYIETCADDYLEFLNSDELNDLLPMFNRLNIVVLCGFESVQEFTRDVLYTKSLKLTEFEEVVERNKSLGLQTGAFLYAGFHSMTQKEILADIVLSLCYLYALDAIPVVMIPKLHELTLTDLLYRYEKYNLIDPYTVLRIAKIITWMSNGIFSPLKKDRWMMSDLIDDIPASSTTVFNNKRKVVCEDCAIKIRDGLQIVRSSADYLLLDKVEESVRSCNNGCYERYLKKMEEDESNRKRISLYLKAELLLNFADRKKRQYAQSILLSRRLIKKEKPNYSLVRKELLCFGLNTDEETLIRLRAFNESFGKEKFVHVAQVQFPDKSYVNVPVVEDYCKLSFYTVKIEGNDVWLFRNGIRQFLIFISSVPEWISKTLPDGARASEVLGVHGHNTLALVRHNACCYKTMNKGCKYCSSDTYSSGEVDKVATPIQIAETVQIALQENDTYSLALSGGSFITPDRGAKYFSIIAKKVLEISPNIGVSVEIAPPESNEYIDMLFDSGVRTIIMNLEFFDDLVKEKFCPGKSEISKSRYFDSLQYAVSRFGVGQVSLC